MNMKISNESKVGIFAAISITILILGYNFLKGRDLFTSTNTYYAVFSQVDGLMVSSPVVVNGYRIGQVRSVDPMPHDSMKLLVAIEVRRKIPVPVNSTIKLASAGFMGEKKIELVLGNDTRLAENRDTLSAYLEPGLAENLNKITEPLREKVSSILAGLDSTFNGESGAALREAMEKLPATMTSINSTLVSVNQTVDKRLAELLDNAIAIEKMILANEADIRSAVTNLKTFSDTLAALDMKATMERANKALTELDIMLTNINEGKGTLGQLAQNDALYNELKNVSTDLDALLKDLKENPGRYVRVSVFGGKKD